MLERREATTLPPYLPTSLPPYLPRCLDGGGGEVDGVAGGSDGRQLLGAFARHPSPPNTCAVA